MVLGCDEATSSGPLQAVESTAINRLLHAPPPIEELLATGGRMVARPPDGNAAQISTFPENSYRGSHPIRCFLRLEALSRLRRRPS